MHLGRRSRDREPTGWNWRLRLAELLLLPAGYWLYAVIRDNEGRAQQPAALSRAQVDAEQLLRLERHVGMAWERGTQEVFLKWPGLVRALDSFWSYGYLLVTVTVLVCALCQRPAVYRRLRTTFALSTAVAIGVFAVFPTVPPRLLPPSYGMVDTWVSLGGIAARTPPEIERLSDPFASFPSIHVAWATWCVVAVASMTRRRWARGLTCAYLALTIVAVVATANHFIVDCVAGVALTAVALAAATGIEQLWARARWRAGTPMISPGPADITTKVPVAASTDRGATPRAGVVHGGETGPSDGDDQGRESSTALTA